MVLVRNWNHKSELFGIFPHGSTGSGWYDSSMPKKPIDIEIAYRFPVSFSREDRARLGRWSVIFVLFSVLGVPLLVLFLR